MSQNLKHNSTLKWNEKNLPNETPFVQVNFHAMRKANRSGSPIHVPDFIQCGLHRRLQLAQSQKDPQAEVKVI